MIDQKDDKLSSTQKGRWKLYNYMVCCITLGLNFSCIRNLSNQTLVINLTSKKILYLDFSLWNLDLELATLYDNNVPLHMKLCEIQETLLTEGKRNAVIISQEKKDWVKFCYKNRLPFDCLDNVLTIHATSTVEDQLKISLIFSADGLLTDVKCALCNVVNHYRDDIMIFVLGWLEGTIIPHQNPIKSDLKGGVNEY